MSTEEPDEPRRTIATSSLRALRAARGDTPPPTSTSPDETAADDTADTVVDDVKTDDTVTDTSAVNTVESDETAADVDSVNTDAETAVETEPVAETEPDSDEADPVAEVDTDTDTDDTDDDDTDTDTDTDDTPPVLASGRPRHTKRTPTDTPAPKRRRPSRRTAISAAVAAAALVFGVVSGVVWWRADHDTERAAAVARDDVVVDARLAVATVNTSDYRKPDAALRNWLAVSAGSLKSQFTDQRKPAITLLGQSKIITSATVLDAAVTKLDTAKGSATVIVSVNLKRKPATGAATTARNRFRATLTRQGDDWKLADLVLVGFQVQ